MYAPSLVKPDKWMLNTLDAQLKWYATSFYGAWGHMFPDFNSDDTVTQRQYARGLHFRSQWIGLAQRRELI